MLVKMGLRGIEQQVGNQYVFQTLDGFAARMLADFADSEILEEIAPPRERRKAGAHSPPPSSRSEIMRS